MSITKQIRNAIARRQRRRFLHSIDSVSDLQDRNAHFSAMRQSVREAGTDSMAYFRNGYTHEGGLCLQQNPDEFTSLCLFLMERRPLRHYMEIGSASGGACFFLQQHLEFESLLCLDDGNHPRAPEQDRHFSKIENLTRFHGDSHSEAARKFLTDHVTESLDVAFIDGDHSYEGVKLDIELTLPFCHSGTLLIMHDTVACEGVQRVWKELVDSDEAQAEAEFIGVDVPLGIGIASVI